MDLFIIIIVILAVIVFVTMAYKKLQFSIFLSNSKSSKTLMDIAQELEDHPEKIVNLGTDTHREYAHTNIGSIRFYRSISNNGKVWHTLIALNGQYLRDDDPDKKHKKRLIAQLCEQIHLAYENYKSESVFDHIQPEDIHGHKSQDENYSESVIEETPEETEDQKEIPKESKSEQGNYKALEI